jgi:hypothetical protein
VAIKICTITKSGPKVRTAATASFVEASSSCWVAAAQAARAGIIVLVRVRSRLPTGLSSPAGCHGCELDAAAAPDAHITALPAAVGGGCDFWCVQNDRKERERELLNEIRLLQM